MAANGISLAIIIRPKQSIALEESWNNSTGQKNGVDVLGCNSAESEPIWM